MTDKIIRVPSLDPINLLVGQGIQAFAGIELSLGMCFATMMTPADRRRSVTVFHTIKTVDGKFGVLEALAPLALNAEEMTEWKSILKKLRSMQKSRNKLAHWNASLYPGASSAEDYEKMRPALIPPIWSEAAMRTLWGTEQPLSVRQLENMVAEMHGAVGLVARFDGKLLKRYESDPTPPS